jgi:hypothetical protein
MAGIVNCRVLTFFVCCLQHPNLAAANLSAKFEVKIMLSFVNLTGVSNRGFWRGE